LAAQTNEVGRLEIAVSLADKDTGMAASEAPVLVKLDKGQWLRRHGPNGLGDTIMSLSARKLIMNYPS
jgi:hypothetical protein